MWMGLTRRVIAPDEGGAAMEPCAADKAGNDQSRLIALVTDLVNREREAEGRSRHAEEVLSELKLRFSELERRLEVPRTEERRPRRGFFKRVGDTLRALERRIRRVRKSLFSRGKRHELLLQPLATGETETADHADGLRNAIKRSGLFVASVYESLHEDVRGHADPLGHYAELGIEERRPFTSTESTAQAFAKAASEIDAALREAENLLSANAPMAAVQRAAAELASRGARIAIYCNSQGNFFMQEIANLLHWQLSALGVTSQLRHETSPFAENFDIRIFVAPHEFFWLGRGVEWRPFVSRPGSVLYNVEQMQTPWFCAAFPLLLQAPLVLDINLQSATVLRKAGLRAVHYMPPHLQDCAYAAPQQDVSHIDVLRGYEFARKPFDWTRTDFSERPIDLLFVGTGNARRLGAIERLRELTDKYRFVCIYTQQTAPLRSGVYRTTSPEINCALAQRAKIVLNLHRDWIGYFEWSRMVMQGLWQGACVVSDPGLKDPVFHSGEHFLEENIRHLPELLEWLLGSPQGRAKMEQVAATGYLRATSDSARAAMLAPMLDALTQELRRESRR
jgi:hypothetical protein